MLLVGSGGFVGSVTRYALAVAFQRHSLTAPVGTLAANLAGCFIIGALAQLSPPTGFLSPTARLLLMTGFCGGFTTMSSLAYETVQFLRDGEYLRGGGYLAATVLGSLVCFVLGVVVVKVAFRHTGGLWN